MKNITSQFLWVCIAFVVFSGQEAKAEFGPVTNYSCRYDDSISSSPFVDVYFSPSFRVLIPEEDTFLNVLTEHEVCGVQISPRQDCFFSQETGGNFERSELFCPGSQVNFEFVFRPWSRDGEVRCTYFSEDNPTPNRFWRLNYCQKIGPI